MATFDDYVQARGGELLKLARALAGDERLARDLVFGALADARSQWARIAEENPETYLRQAILRGYLSPWRRSSRASAGDVLAPLPKPQRAVLVLRFLAGLSYLQIAEHIEGSPTGAARLAQLALETVEEAEVVAALENYASTSPGASVLVKGATAAARRRSRRRVMVAASVIAVLVAVSVLAKPTAKPVPQPTAVPTPSPTHTYLPSPVRMVAAIVTLPVFPYRATYLPSGAGSPTIRQEGDTIAMDYENFAVSVSPTQPASEPNNPVDHIWQRDGRWLRLVTSLSLAEADLVAAGLAPGETTMTPAPPFTITLMPVGYKVRRANPQSICLAANQNQSSAGLCVTALPEDLGQVNLPGQPATVAVQGRTAHLIYPNDLWAEVWIHLDDRSVIRVSLEQQTPFEMLNKEDLLTFAEGILIQG